MVEEILLEKKLTTDFTMGFELEGCWYDEDASDSEISDWFDTNLGSGGEIHYDGSVHPDDRGGRSFEYASPVLRVNVGSIEKILNMYRAGVENQFYTNNSCGYHHHISFPGITAEDMIWIMCNLAIDDRMRSEISSFEGIQFANDRWADDEYLDNLADAVHNLDYEAITRICQTEKYSLVNVHAHHTLEWRGPRGVVDEGDINLIRSFYQRFWTFVKWMTDALDKKEIEGVDKTNFIDGIKATFRGFDIRGFQFEKGKGQKTEEFINKAVSEIISEPKELLKYNNSKDILERIIQILYNKNRLGTRIKKLLEEGYGDRMRNICDICVKYIPYRMMKQASTHITSDSIYNLSEMSIKRLFATSKLDGVTVHMSDILSILTEYRDKLNGQLFADIGNNLMMYKEANIPQWGVNHLPFIAEILYPNGCMQHFENLNALADMLSKTIFEGNEDAEVIKYRLQILMTVFIKSKPETGRVIAKNLLKNAYAFPEIIIPYLNLTEKSLLYLISNARMNHPEMLDRIASTLLKTKKLTQSQLDAITLELRDDESRNNQTPDEDSGETYDTDELNSIDD